MNIETRKVSLTTKDIEIILEKGAKYYQYIRNDGKYQSFGLLWPDEITCTIIENNLWVINTESRELICIVHNFRTKLPPDGFIEKKIHIVEINEKEEIEKEEFNADDIFVMIGMMYDDEYDNQSKNDIFEKIQKSMKKAVI